MNRRRDPWVFIAALTLYVGWTLAVLNGWAGTALDSRFATDPMTPRSAPGQAAEAFALITHPYVILVLTLVLALRTFQQRQRRLSLALTVSAAGILFWDVQRVVFDRPRPDSPFADSLSATGAAYPAGHIVAATVLTWMLVTLANAQRKSVRSQWKRRILGTLLIAWVGVSQWALGIQHLSDMVGGLLYGVTVATGALWLSGVDEITSTWQTRRLPAPHGRRAAVIYNPTKIDDLDLLRRRVAFAMARGGWEPALWLETELHDPGREMARDAITKGVDRVLIVGGDGTARTVCAELAGSGIPAALVPAGTGNLLGRNLRIPLDEDEALDIALNGTPRQVDLIRWSAEDSDAPFVVMAGVGLDAQIMQHTDPRLKRVVKAGAYVVAGVQQVTMPEFHAKVWVDDEPVHDGPAIMVLIGNVGRLQGGVTLIPTAEADDGLLHVMIATGAGVRGLARALASIRREGNDTPIRRVAGTRVRVELDRAVPFQLDGDAEGETTGFSAEVQSAALRVMSGR